MITLERVSKQFPNGRCAPRELDLEILDGEITVLIGPSGCGKTTTLRLINRLAEPTAGRVVIDGEDVALVDPVALRRGIGYVIQHAGLFPHRTVLDNVATVPLLTGKSKRVARARAAELLELVGLPARRAQEYPHQLSGGQRQRVLIGLALACEPRLLIADEPTSALDVTVQRQVLDHLQSLTAELGTAVLLITHDLALAGERAEQLVVMHRGRVVETGTAQSILTDPQHPYTQRLVAAAPSMPSVGGATTRPRTATAAVADAHLLIGSGLTKVYRSSDGTPWRKKEFRVVDGVSFSLRKATTLAIVGESGSGKSTLARMVLGLLAPTCGTVTFDGRDVFALSRREAQEFRRRVQPVFQNPYSSLDPMYTVFRAVEEPLRIHRVGNRRERRAAVRELVEQVALPSSVLDRRPRELSGGQRQRVAIARALALRPEVLVCDEAVSALDVVVQAQILELLAGLKDALGLSYLFISHDLAVIRQIADEVLVMRAGQVVEHAPTDEVFTQPRHDYTRELLAAIPRQRPYGDSS